jgi:hypothetical protein
LITPRSTQHRQHAEQHVVADDDVGREALQHLLQTLMLSGHGIDEQALHGGAQPVRPELCRREGIAASMYYGWSKEFPEAGKRPLAGDTARAATSDEVKNLRQEATALKVLFGTEPVAGFQF